MSDAIARSLGFESAAEMHRLIAAADISTPVKWAQFRAWQSEDGTKAGLEALKSA
jgi:hypothetical protein